MTKTELKTTIERIVEKKVKLEVKKQLVKYLLMKATHQKSTNQKLKTSCSTKRNETLYK